jgi:hypothetical protein
MKTKLTRIFAIAALGLFSVAAFPRPAVAQSGFQGRFTLPYEVRWQNVTLPAGDYTFLIPSTDVLMSRMTITGPEGSMYELGNIVSHRQSSDRNVLILEQRGGTYFVRELDLSTVGAQIRYQLPKQSRQDKLLAKASPATEQVLVATAKQ